MRKLFRAIYQSEVICSLLLLTSLIFALDFMYKDNPIDYSLSQIGRLFWRDYLLWGLFTGLAILFNVNRLYNRTGYSSKIGKFLLHLSLIMLFFTVINITLEPILYYTHVVTSIAFAVLSFAPIMMCLVSTSFKSFRYFILTFLLLIMAVIDVYYITIYSHMALFQTIPLVACYIVLFLCNFTQSFKLN